MQFSEDVAKAILKAIEACDPLGAVEEESKHKQAVKHTGPKMSVIEKVKFVYSAAAPTQKTLLRGPAVPQQEQPGFTLPPKPPVLRRKTKAGTFTFDISLYILDAVEFAWLVITTVQKFFPTWINTKHDSFVAFLNSAECRRDPIAIVLFRARMKKWFQDLDTDLPFTVLPRPRTISKESTCLHLDLDGVTEFFRWAKQFEHAVPYQKVLAKLDDRMLTSTQERHLTLRGLLYPSTLDRSFERDATGPSSFRHFTGSTVIRGMEFGAMFALKTPIYAALKDNDVLELFNEVGGFLANMQIRAQYEQIQQTRGKSN
jgi:hypothetical protein